MALQRAKHRAGLVIGRAKNDRRAALCQFDQQRIAPGDAMGVDDDGGNLVQRHAAQQYAFGLDLQKSPFAGQMPTFLADIYDLVQNGNSSR